MLDISRVLFVPTSAAESEAAERGVVKKLVDRRFTKADKERVLRNKGIEGQELQELLESFVQEAILPTGRVDLVQEGSVGFVFESESIALSYTSGQAPEDPHWHPDEVETYLFSRLTNVAIRSIDEQGPHKILSLPPGRLILPARICHFVDPRGQTEVMSFRQRSDMHRVGCVACPLYENGDCRGLHETGGQFGGEKELISFVQERKDWLASLPRHIRGESA